MSPEHAHAGDNGPALRQTRSVTPKRLRGNASSEQPITSCLLLLGCATVICFPSVPFLLSGACLREQPRGSGVGTSRLDGSSSEEPPARTRRDGKMGGNKPGLVAFPGMDLGATPPRISHPGGRSRGPARLGRGREGGREGGRDGGKQ